jgi:hypothetical protein
MRFKVESKAKSETPACVLYNRGTRLCSAVGRCVVSNATSACPKHRLCPFLFCSYHIISFLLSTLSFDIAPHFLVESNYLFLLTLYPLLFTLFSLNMPIFPFHFSNYIHYFPIFYVIIVYFICSKIFTFLGITPVSSVSNDLYFLTVPLVSVMRVIYTPKGMSKKFGVRLIH